MAISFRCSQCGQSFQVPEEHAGRQGKCHRCGHVLLVPQASAAPAGGLVPTSRPAEVTPPPGPAGQREQGTRVASARRAPVSPGHRPPVSARRAAWRVAGIALLVVLAWAGTTRARRTVPAAAPGSQTRATDAGGMPSGSAHPVLAQAPAGGAGTMRAAALESGPAAGEWTRFRGPNHDGKSPDTGLLKAWPAGGPPRVWQASGIGPGYSSPTISDGRVFITGLNGGDLVLTALDAGTGQKLWSVPAGPDHTGDRPGSRSSATIDGQNLYLISGAGLIGCYDVRNGARRWTREMGEFGGKPSGWGYAESVLILGNLAIVTPGGKNCIVALNKSTGQPVWASTGFAARAHYGSLIAATYQGVPMVIAGTGDGIFGVSARDGSLLWQNGFCAGNTANCPSPAYSDGYVFWANGYGKGGICLKLSSDGRTVRADEAWTTLKMNCHHGGYVILDGCIYGNNGGGLACLDLKTGAVRWEHRGMGKGSILYADGMFYLFGEYGGWAGLGPASPDGFRLTGQFQVAGRLNSWAHPVVIGGRLYLRYDDNLYCFDVKQR